MPFLKDVASILEGPGEEDPEHSAAALAPQGRAGPEPWEEALLKILILTGKFGMGHVSAAQSLRQRFLEEDSRVEAQVVDFIEYSLHSASEAWYKGFSLLVTHGSGIFNAYYKMSDKMNPDARMRLGGLFLDRFQDLVEEEKPDLVVATHPICAQVVAEYKWETGSALPLVTCLTDLTDHSEWINRGADCYMVGLPVLRDLLAEKGVERERVVVTGIPVRSEFRRVIPHRGEGEKQVLIMGGGLGLLPEKNSFYERLDAIPGVKVTIIAGQNEKLREKLDGKYENITVLGYTDRVWEYMAGADLLLSKPGGITIFEAIHCELPFLAWDPFLQQERSNAQFLVHAGIGAVAEKESGACAEAVERLIRDQPRLDKMGENMRKLKDELEKDWLEAILSALGKGVCAS